MTDVLLIAAIIAFFAASALLVRVLDRMIEGSRSAAEDAALDEDDLAAELDPGRQA